MNAQLTTREDDSHISDVSSDLIADTASLISGKASGHMLPHSYNERGMSFWAKAVNHPQLPANKEIDFVSDPEVIDSVVRHLQAIDSIPAFVELGPGLPESVRRKTIPLLKHFQAVTGKPIEYHAFDISPEAAQSCADLVESEIPGSKVFAIQGDFLKYEGKLSTEGRPSIGIMWGGTLWNASSNPGMRDQFVLAGNGDKISQLLGEKALLLQTYHWASEANPNSVLVPYKTEAVRGLIGNILTVIRDSIESDFDPSKFKIVVSYNEDLQRVSFEAECIQGHSVRFKTLGNISRVFKKGERLHLASSHKRTNVGVEELLEQQMSHVVLDNSYDKNLNLGLVLSQRLK